VAGNGGDVGRGGALRFRSRRDAVLRGRRKGEKESGVGAAVIIITHEFFPYPGGIAVYALETALTLAAHGREVTVWCPPNAALAAAAVAARWPFRVEEIAGNRGTQDWRCRLATARHWRARAEAVRGAEVLLLEPGAVRTACYGWLFGLPEPARLLVVLHGSEIFYLTRWPHRRWLLARLLAQAEAVGVVSEFCRRLLVKRAGVEATKVRLVPGALRTDLAAGEAAAGEAVAGPARTGTDGHGRTRTHANADTHTHTGAGGAVLEVLCVARIHPRKGQLELLRAVAALPEEMRKRVVVRFAGKCVRGGYQRALEKFARESGICAEFSGSVSGAKLREFYDGAAVFALPSLAHANSIESFGMVYLEAGAHGLPVLAHDTGGVSDAVLDGETGILVSPGDGAALAAALRRLLEDAALRRRLGENGRRHAQRFSWARNVERLLGE
jgi:glycosyltransferase involved in cell wall biosynthesis